MFGKITLVLIVLLYLIFPFFYFNSVASVVNDRSGVINFFWTVIGILAVISIVNAIGGKSTEEPMTNWKPVLVSVLLFVFFKIYVIVLIYVGAVLNDL